MLLTCKICEAENSGGGPPQSKTLARGAMTSEMREASWTTPALWRFQPHWNQDVLDSIKSLTN
jgi:hypothetical protein